LSDPSTAPMRHLTERHTAELAYHRERARTIAAVGPTPDGTLERYRRHRLWRLFPKEFMFKCLGEIAGKSILDFGCGEGKLTTQLARLGAQVTGFDISPELIAIAQRRAVLDGVQDCVGFLLADGAESELAEDMFDAIICQAVLHRVDIFQVVPRLVRSLRPGGIVIMVEPVDFSLTYQRIRHLIPIAKVGSPSARQLGRDEVAFLLGTLTKSRVEFFNLFGRLARLLPNRNKIDHGHPFTRTAIVLLLSVDRFLLTLFPFLWRLCGTVVIVGTKPAAGSAA